MATWFAAKKDLKPDGDEKKGRYSFFARNQQKIAPYVFISPFFLIFTVFFLIPSITALVLSVFKWNGIGTPEFFQLKNYIRMFGDDVFWQAVFNTSIYAAVSLFVVVPLAMVLAVLLNSKHLRYKTLWRAMYYTPVVTSSVAIAIVFQLIYAKESGFLNAGLGLFGIEPISWLGDRVWAKVAISLLIVWTNTGLVSIYFLAGLQGISQSLYEAASIDGASPLQQFFHITVPMLRPIMLFVSILAILGAVQIFDQPNILTQGGPANATLSIVQYLFNRGFTRLRFGFASSVGTFLFVVVFIMSLIQLQRYGTFKDEEK